jgi:hypothetical protein
MFNQDTVKALSAMFKAASTDETRYHLCAVFITKHSNALLKLEATNGHISAKRFIECQEITELLKPCECISLNHDQMKAIKATKSKFFGVTREEKWLTISDGVAAVKLEVEQRKDSRYPKLEYIESQNKAKQPITITFNAELIHLLAQALAENPKRPMLTLTLDLSAANQCAYSVKCGENEGLLMPLRADGSVDKANRETLAQLTATKAKGA